MPSVTVLFNKEEINSVNLSKDVYIIGRHEECDIKIDNLGISRNHARIIKDGDCYAIEDLGSSNGTFVNGEKITKQTLNDGDTATIGKYEIKYLDRERTGSTLVNVHKQTAILPDDTLNTMEMDAGDIKRQFEELQKEKPIEKAHNTASTEKPAKQQNDAEIKAREAEIELLKKEMQTTRLLTLTIAVVAIIAVVAAVVMSLK